MRTCPPGDRLEALLAGGLGPDETAGVSAHIERCRACRAALEALTAEPESRRWAALRSTAERRPDGPTPAFLARLQQSVPRRSSRLGPTSLGRIAAADDTPVPAPAAPVAPPGYEILGYLGRGGMGVVHKARHRALKRTVALKMLRPEAVAEPDQRARLVGEAETVARLHHPNIAQIYEVGEQGGLPYIALEYVEGPTLAQVLGGRPHPPRVAAGLVATLARAAHHAHTLGVVHRDLKPGNILLAPAAPDVPPTPDACVPKISDFGLAKRLDDMSHTQTGMVVGTPCYMAPEQARGPAGGVTPLADVYALGAILYELLTGRPPLVGLTTVDTVVRVLHEEPARPRSLVPGVPADLETVCLKCLEKDPRRRYRSADALADDLDRFLAGTSVLARPLGRPARAWRWARRHPTAAALLAVLLAVAAVGFPGVTALWLEARANERQAVAAEGRARAAEEGAVRARAAIARQTTNLLSDPGFRLIEEGNVGDGLLWLVEALAVCPAETDADADMREVLRANLADWAALLPRPAGTLDLDEVTQSAFSADGRLLATADVAGTVRVWDAATGAPVAGPFAHSRPATDLAFRPDGRALLVGYGYGPARPGDGRALVWDLATGQPVGPDVRTGPGGAQRVAWSPDGQTIAVGIGTRLRTFDAASGEPRGGPWATRSEIIATRFTPDGRGLLVGHGYVYVDRGWRSKGTVERIDLATGGRAPLTEDESGRPCQLDLAADRPFLGTGDGASGALVQPLAAGGGPAGEPVRLPGGFGGLTPDGGTVLVQDADRTVRFADRVTGRVRGGLRLTWGGEYAVRMSPVGDRFLCRSELWAPPRPRARPPVPAPEDGRTVNRAAGPVAGRIALMRTGHLSVVDLTGRLVGRPAGDGFGGALALSPDGARLVVNVPQADPNRGELQVRDVQTGALVAGPFKSRQVGGIGFSPDGGLLAVGTYGGQAAIHDLAAGTSRDLKPEVEIITSVAFRPGGRQLALGLSQEWNRSPGVRLVDVATGQRDEELLPHVNIGLRQVAYSPDGGRVFAGSEAHVRLWDVDQRVALGPPIPVVGVPPGQPFSPDGRWIACQVGGHQMRIYSAATGAAAGPPLAGTAPVTAYQFSPDSRWLLTGYADGTARVWSVLAHRPRGPAVAQRHRVMAVGWAADGRAFYTVSATAAVRRWPLTPVPADDPAALRAAIELLAAARMDTGPAVSPLGREEWRDRFTAFRAAYGSFDPVLGPVLTEAEWHDQRARDAEEEGDGPTARYHLDRRLAAVPGDGAAVVRRMHQHALAGDWAAAAADRRRALDLLGPEDVEAWCRHFELVSHLGGRADAEHWYADRPADR